MKRALLWVIGVECLLLAGGLGLHLLGGLERFERPSPPLPVFRPPLHDTRIGDMVRYERRDRATGKVLGYLDYEVRQVIVTKGTTIGPEIVLFVKDSDVDGPSRERILRIQPRALMKGFLPPRFDDEDDFPAGERAVVSRISTATFPLQERPPSGPTPSPVRGFLVEAVIPRRSLTGIAERYWMTEEVPVFGVARWERGNELLVLHRMEKPKRTEPEAGK
ncbi:MAG: hypothetical protein L6Q95_03855 [Planctomycetes bacterium]|nr:hypothetical protein [Planctomycetota bacterium]